MMVVARGARGCGGALASWRRLLATGGASPRTLLETEAFVVKSLAVTPFEMNMYLVGCKATGEAAIVDAGDDAVGRWVEAAGDLAIRHLLQTHGHVDHVAGLAAFKAALPDAPVYLHPLDDWIAAAAPAQGLAMGMRCPAPPAADVALADGDALSVGAVSLDVLHTPGHAPGHVAFHAPAHGVLFGGDLLFRGSIGRTDFPGCDVDDMQASLRRVAALPAETVVFPGHMGPTTIGDEVATNPFLQGL